MKQTLNKPCSECPFKVKSVRGWLGPYKVEELHRFVMNENHFGCHSTIHDDDQDPDTVEHCVGSILYMNKNAKSCRDKELRKLQKRFESFDKSEILSLPEFLEHHSIEKIFKKGKTK